MDDKTETETVETETETEPTVSASPVATPAPSDDTAARLSHVEDLVGTLVDKLAKLLPDTSPAPAKKPWISR